MDDKGSTLIIALVMLALLSVLGIAVTTTSSIEVQIAANDRTYTHNFYIAETALNEAISELLNGTISVVNNTEVDWLKSKRIDPAKIEDFKTWLLDADNHEKIAIDMIEGGINYKTYIGYAAVGPVAVEGGMGMGLSQPVVRTYLIFAFYDKPDEPNRGQIIIDMGYKKVGS